MNLKDLRQKPDSTKRRILIGVAIILIIILGTWWWKNTRQHFQEAKQEEIKINFPTSTINN